MPQRRGSAAIARSTPGFVHTRFEGRTTTASTLATALRVTAKPIISTWATFPTLPWPYFVVDYAGRPLRRVRGTKVSRVRLRNCPAELVRPAGEPSGRHVLYLHGGAFVVGGRHLHRQLISHVARATESTALAVNYRKLPHHSIETAVADCLDGYRHLLAEGVAPEQIVFVGDSAGGYLVLMTAVAAIREGLPAPAGIVAISPLTDFDPTAKITAPSAQTCALFGPSAMRMFGRFAARDGRPIASPADTDLHGLPPTLVQVARGEILYPDAELIAQRLAAAGVVCELQSWDNDIHVFQAAAGIAREAMQAISEIGEFVKRVAPTSAIPQRTGQAAG